MALSYPPQKADNFVTFWELYEHAAKARYGEDIQVIKTQFYRTKVNNIDFEVSVVKTDGEPREVRHTIVDINMKEFSNLGKEQDETSVKIDKSSTKGNRFSFSTTKGIDFGHDCNIGAKVMGLAAVGSYGAAKREPNELGFSFSYHHEEKITVPPGKRVKAKITTYSIKYEVDYTLKLSIKKDAFIPVMFRTKCQQFCLDMCRNNGSVLVRDMISTLPNYVQEDENGMSSFTQMGTLSWIGEGCTVDKKEEDL